MLDSILLCDAGQDWDTHRNPLKPVYIHRKTQSESQYHICLYRIDRNRRHVLVS